MRMLEPNATSNNSSVLGTTSGLSNGLLPPMQTSMGTIGSTGDRLDASSDSAVSSMGSERVPSLSDGEWGDAGSDSAQDFHQRYIIKKIQIFSNVIYTKHYKLFQQIRWSIWL